MSVSGSLMDSGCSLRCAGCGMVHLQLHRYHGVLHFAIHATGDGDWHTAPRRQYVITLSGQAELEVSGGKKIRVGPGHIDLVEDTTGKGHITRVTGTEDRVTLQLPFSDQSPRATANR